MDIDAVLELDREKDITNEKQFRDGMDQAANDSYMETHIPSVVEAKFSTTWIGRGGKEGQRAYAVYSRDFNLIHLQRQG